MKYNLNWLAAHRKCWPPKTVGLNFEVCLCVNVLKTRTQIMAEFASSAEIIDGYFGIKWLSENQRAIFARCGLDFTSSSHHLLTHSIRLTVQARIHTQRAINFTIIKWVCNTTRHQTSKRPHSVLRIVHVNRTTNWYTMYTIVSVRVYPKNTGSILRVLLPLNQPTNKRTRASVHVSLGKHTHLFYPL